MAGLFDEGLTGPPAGTAGALEPISEPVATPGGGGAEQNHQVLPAEYGVLWERPDVIGARGWSDPWEPNYHLADWPDYAFDYTRDQIVERVTILASFTNDVDQTGARGNFQSQAVGVQDPQAYRIYQQFAIAALNPTAAIAKIEARVNCSGAFTNSAQSYAGGPYNGDGSGDPAGNPDGAAVYGRCDVSGDNYIAADTSFRNTGLYTFDLGAQAVADLTAARARGDSYFSIAWRQTDESLGADAWAQLDGRAMTSPPALIVTYGVVATVTITDAEDEQLSEGETGFIISGTGFGGSQGSGSVELNTAADGSGTIVTQAVTSWADNQIIITATHGALGLGSAYLIVRTDNGQRSNGWPVMLVATTTSDPGAYGLTSAHLSMDAPTVEEIVTVDTSTLAGLYKIATGDFRVPITKDYAKIRFISPPLFASVGGKWTSREVDRDVVIGPRLQLFLDGVLTDAVITVEIKGN